MIKTNRNGQLESFKFLHSVLFQERRWFDMLHFFSFVESGFSSPGCKLLEACDVWMGWQTC